MKTKFSGILTLLLALVVQVSFAQQKTVTGTVSDDSGLPLPGANVIIKGSSSGTQTDFDGKYAISVEPGKTLTFSYVGFETQEIVVEASNTISVQMAPGNALDEVVITTYGRTTARDLTTNVSKPDMETVQSITTSNVAGALQGTVAGAQINSVSGAPGGEVSIRIRGASTINGNSNPLFVIDGIPMITEATISDNFGNQQNSALSNLNIDDIESVEVLKDAASTAVYGQRGSNGVVLITTKQGKRGGFRININSTVGFQNAIEKYDTMNYGQWLKFRDTASQNGGADSGSFSANDADMPQLLGASQETLQAFYDSVADVGDSYIDEVYVDNAVTRNNNFNLSGGNDKTKMYFGASHFFQEGTVLTQDFDRKSARLNITQQISNSIDFVGGVSITDEFVNQIVNDNNIFGVLSTGILERPGLDLRDENGDFTPYQQFTFSNPLQNALEDLGKLRTFRVIGNAALNFQITDEFSAETKVGLDQSEVIERIYNPSTTAQGNFGVNNGFGQETQATRRIYQVRQSFSYNKSWENIRMRAYLGGEYETNSTRFVIAAAEDFPSPLLQYVGQGITPLTSSSEFGENKRASLISRLGFTFWNKLILEGSIRADASSRFSEDDRTGYFPGLSAAYIVSEHDWFENNFVDYLKIRGSYGITGNESPFDRYFAPAVATSQYADQAALFLTIGEATARWEETEQIDVGFNVKFWDSRVDLNYAYFLKQTHDNSLVLPVALPTNQGSVITPQNVAAMENKGHEIDLNIGVVRNDNFSWNTSFIFGTLDNEVTFLPKNEFGETEPINAGFVSRVDEGEPLGFFYVLESDGLYQDISEIPQELQDQGVAPGDVKYIDQNGDGIINDDDFINGGDPWADFTLSWKNDIRFKKFDLSFLWAMSEGGEIYNNNIQFAGASSSGTFGKFTSQLDWWTPENRDTEIPRPNTVTAGYNNQDATRFIEDGSYIKLRNVTLGYTLPEIKWLASARVFVSGDNLVLITDYSGVDPEINTFGNSNIARGTDFLTQGNSRVWKFGVNLSF
ncbi:SusC/RagA family TonB-linked outer membrane protein [Cochleicola gelatinilyticus]|uniref:TonB-dependent receptor plug domain-containing protein n=1 Tax=Cochleicola gelatinilyticus TaxID=1763537 RepID=A0A167IFX0_9FLAO|nr:SusC/RagA family TonB-linked outer membrane protein [Cochleicola gelatinilyticus]OAB79613.1 hypothetical protein ULVI_02335 [Cochleicola gelatinilyticus]